MKLADKYIIKQVLTATVLSVLLFIIVWISPEILFKIINQAVSGKITPDVAVKLFCLEIPEIFGKAIPVGLLLGSLFVFDRLSKDFELVIMRSTGISLKRLAVPILIISGIFSVFCFFTYDRLIPYSANKIKEIQQYEANAQFVYIDRTENNKPKQAIIVTCFNGKQAYFLDILDFADAVSDNSPLIKKITTATNVDLGNDKWVLKDGIEYKIAPDGVYESIKNFKTKEILNGEKAKKVLTLMKYSVKKSDEFTNSELLSYINLLKAENLEDEYRFMLNKLYQRHAQAFNCILLAICGVILGYGKPRQIRALGFTAAAGIIALYYITVPFIDLLAEKGVLPPLLAACIPCIFVLGCIAGLLKFKEL